MSAAGGHAAPGMLVPMMFVVAVPVIMGQFGVVVLMLVPFGEVQPDPQGHQGGCGNQRPGQWISEDHGKGGAEERGDGEVGARPGGSDVPEPDDEQYEAQSVREESDDHRGSDGPGGWKRCADHEGQQEIDRTGDQALAGGEPGG